MQLPTASEALLKLMVPALAVAVTVPPQPLLTEGVDATCMPVGRVSVKLASIVVLVVLLPLVIVKVRVDAVLGFTVVGLKLKVIDGG